MSRTFVLLYLLSIYLHSGDGAAKRIVRQLTYTTKYDNFDVDAVLNNQRLLRSYANCLLDKGSCTAEGKELKKYIPDALETECSKCNAAQKRIAERILSTLLLNYHDIWDELLAKYDSDGIFLAKYQIPADYDYSILDLA
ncbi:ejaculatory bulb-specific protein 3-like [Aethina tumida]|uniref:ejaculatory bulb-specific protein 3-like n=1 Tax=Aethina tumida TaxID=116153 RepID=UPI002147422B|nr:ejaculatory bulb-specific protein 3-like [Aethina tumida]